MKFVAFACICVVLMKPVLNHVSTGHGVKRARQVRQVANWRDWQWYLSDTPVSMNVKSVWEAGYTGEGILVAVVDDGVKITHPGLKPNVNLNASFDFLDNRNITSNYSPGSHGTMCAGIIAGGKNTCGMGVAFGAKISSIRVLASNRRSTDQSESMGLSYKSDMVDIYSSSWGPGDMGWQVAGPGPRLKEALEKGTRLGRHGKGSIYVFSAGNGGIAGDSCAFNGYVNSIRTIAISAVNWDGSVPAFAEQCAAIMAVTYGQDMFPVRNLVPPMITTQGANDCTERFPGSSGPAALASGIIALVLQAKPDLAWRDIQHLIARSSQPLRPPISNSCRRCQRPSWINNAAGLTVSSHFGFGLMDASRMIQYALEWHTVPPQLSCETTLNVSNASSSRLIIPSRGDLQLTLSMRQDNCSIQYLEHMQIEVSLRFPRRGYVEMLSTSPSGTRSKLLYSRMMDSLTGYKYFTNWRVSSLHYWGERPFGDWNITIRNARPWNIGKGRLFGLKLILYGTDEDPLANNQHVNMETKTIETVKITLREAEIPIHGRYSQWSYWDWCSRACGGGTQKRFRSCTNPPPKNGGRNCIGLASESRSCNTQRCPVHGRWSPWGSWSQCVVTCGAGYKQRRRTCTNPAPAHGGRDCFGNYVQSKNCYLNPCPPVDGGYSPWTSWSQCSATCNSTNGTQHRNRFCTNPPPANGGKLCIGSNRETQMCNNSNACSTPVCKNTAPDQTCQQWSIRGNCAIARVKNWCKKTCGGCQACTNKVSDSDCRAWLSVGHCSNPSVRALCKKTCGPC